MRHRGIRLWLASGATLAVVSYDIWVRKSDRGPTVGVLLIALLAGVLVWLLLKPRKGRADAGNRPKPPSGRTGGRSDDAGRSGG